MKTSTHSSSRPEWFYFILLAFLPVFLAGCSSVPAGPPALEQQALGFSPPPGMAGVYIIRRSSILGNFPIWQINLDYKDVGMLWRGSYFYCVVPPARHFFCELGPSDLTEIFHTTSFTAEAGKNYFFAYRLGSFEELSETEGEQYVRKFNFDGDNRFDVGGQNEGGESTVLLRLNVPRPNYPDKIVPLTYLQALNLDTKTVSNWQVDGQGWVVGYAVPGKYLITRYTETKAGLLSALSRATEIRCQITVPRPDITIYYGTVTPSSQGVEIKRGIDASARDFYEDSVPFKRSELMAGDITAEMQ